MGKATDAELAWAAGLFEGEGCISVRSITLSTGKPRFYGYLQLSMTDKDAVVRFGKILGYGNIRYMPGTNRPTHWKPIWKWSTGVKQRVIQFSEEIGPWLCERRTARLNEILAYYNDDNGPRRVYQEKKA